MISTKPTFSLSFILLFSSSFFYFINLVVYVTMSNFMEMGGIDTLAVVHWEDSENWSRKVIDSYNKTSSQRFINVNGREAAPKEKNKIQIGSRSSSGSSSRLFLQPKTCAMCPGKILIIASKDFDFYKGAKKVATRENKKKKMEAFLS